MPSNENQAITNAAWSLARTPREGWPTNGDFSFTERPVPKPIRGQALTRTIYLSLDPYQWVRRRSGMEAVGDICHGRTVSRVIESEADEYHPGDFIFNTNGWQTHGLVGQGVDVFGYMFPRKLDPGTAPISTAVGLLGMLGLTAYSGVYLQCDPQPGETVVISAASGGVGQAAGQIAKIKGCRVIGIAGAAAKCHYVRDKLGFDDCVSYQSEDYNAELRTACPDGVDIYFENVGGRVLEGVLPLLNKKARITLCGMISQYGDMEGRDMSQVWHEAGASVFNKQNVIINDLFVGDFVVSHQERFLSEMNAWMNDGLLHYREDIWEGLEHTPTAFSALLSGANFGKTLVQVSDDESPTFDRNFETVRRRHR